LLAMDDRLLMVDLRCYFDGNPNLGFDLGLLKLGSLVVWPNGYM